MWSWTPGFQLLNEFILNKTQPAKALEKWMLGRWQISFWGPPSRNVVLFLNLDSDCFFAASLEVQSVRFRVPFCLGFLWPSPLKRSVALVATWCATTVDEHSTNSGPKSAGKVLQFGGSSQVNIKNINKASVSHFSTRNLETWMLQPKKWLFVKCFSFLQ